MGSVHNLASMPSRSRPSAAAIPDSCANCTARSLTICAPLNFEEQSDVAAQTTSVAYKPRQVIFHEGDEAAYVYNITAGSVALSKSMADGRRQITGFLGPGDFLGFNARALYSVSAESLTDVHVCRFQRRAFHDLLARVPTLEHRLLTVATTELEAAQDQILLLGRKTAMERISSFLLMQIQRAKARGAIANPLVLPMTRAEVGDYLGLTIETVSRCFTKLRKLNVISLLSADRVCINDPDALYAMADTAAGEQPA